MKAACCSVCSFRVASTFCSIRRRRIKRIVQASVAQTPPRAYETGVSVLGRTPSDVAGEADKSYVSGYVAFSVGDAIDAELPPAARGVACIDHNSSTLETEPSCRFNEVEDMGDGEGEDAKARKIASPDRPELYSYVVPKQT
jgi:hypothetical protein